MARNTSCIAGAWPSISVIGVSLGAGVSRLAFSASARRTSSSAWSTSNGFGRYSNAPPWNAATALSRSEYAVMMMTGTLGRRSFSACSSSRPDTPGMRMSDSTALGWLRSSSRSASLAELKVMHGISSRSSAFSSTQRMERSSSMIQTQLDFGMAFSRKAEEK